ncbi:MAG: hypothetical protein IJ975_00580, partial [Clostridia bacterium]|nr:hypothetical protein [Clostridia bacterium]
GSGKTTIGRAIIRINPMSDGIIKDSVLYYEGFRDIVQSDELEAGEVLVLSEGILGTAKVATGSNHNSNYYSGSPLKSSIDAIANNFTDEEKTFIVPQTINSRQVSWGTNTVNNALLFPLATNYYYDDNLISTTAYDSQNSCNQSFCIEDYFSALKENFVEGGTAPVDPLLSATSIWWLRSGITINVSGCACVSANGELITYAATSDSHGVRPAFVLNLFA